jgi:hypothetical protein
MKDVCGIESANHHFLTAMKQYSCERPLLWNNQIDPYSIPGSTRCFIHSGTDASHNACKLARKSSIVYYKSVPGLKLEASHW